MLVAPLHVHDGDPRLLQPAHVAHLRRRLVRFGGRAAEVREKLADAGVLVRDRSYELAGCVRVTVGTREQTARFLAELERIWR